MGADGTNPREPAPRASDSFGVDYAKPAQSTAEKARPHSNFFREVDEDVKKAEIEIVREAAVVRRFRGPIKLTVTQSKEKANTQAQEE